MAGFIRSQVILRSGTGLPADDVTNTLYWVSTGLSPADTAASAQTKIETFYTAFDQSVLSGGLLLTGADVKHYDLTEPEPRVPILEDSFTLTLASGAALPSECAICLSFQATPVSGQSQARRRGRIYIGPIDIDAVETNGARVLVSAATRTSLASAADAMWGGTAATEAVWAVFSPTTAGPPPWSEGTLGDSMAFVSNGWIDNALDTQRRRGTRSTARTLWS